MPQIRKNKYVIDRISERIDDFYSFSGNRSRWNKKSDFNSNVLIGDKEVSIFDSDKINDTLFINGYRDVDLRAFFLSPYNRNISTIRFSLSQISGEYYMHGHTIYIADIIASPPELENHSVFTISGDTIFWNSNSAPSADPWDMAQYLEFIIKIRKLLSEKISLVTWLKMADLLTEPNIPCSLQELFVGMVIGNTDYFRSHGEHLKDLLLFDSHCHGFCKLVPSSISPEFMETGLNESAFHVLIKDLGSLLQGLCVDHSADVIEIDNLYMCVLKDCRVDVKQEYSPLSKFTSQRFISSLQRNNTAILDRAASMVEQWYEKHVEKECRQAALFY